MSRIYLEFFKSKIINTSLYHKFSIRCHLTQPKHIANRRHYGNDIWYKAAKLAKEIFETLNHNILPDKDCFVDIPGYHLQMVNKTLVFICCYSKLGTCYTAAEVAVTAYENWSTLETDTLHIYI